MKEAEDTMKSFLQHISHLPFDSSSPSSLLESAKEYVAELEKSKNPFIVELLQMGNDTIEES
jgi:hypothetical protein